MQAPLYLDTARLGQMSQPACDASIDFARFAIEHGCTLYLTQFLKQGFAGWPSALRRRYPGLRHWHGVRHLEADFRQLAEATSNTDVLLTSRPATLMKLAARLFSGSCRHVLITDSCWPAYRSILDREFSSTATSISAVRVRQRALRESASANELIDVIADAFIQRGCDGLFIPLIDNLGVRLPVDRLVSHIRRQAELRFVVVDAAQAVGQVPMSRELETCDFIFGSSHKWLRAFHTLGIGYSGHPASRTHIARTLHALRQKRVIDDPLLEFSDELATGVERPYGETVPVAPLVVTAAAVRHALMQPPTRWPVCEMVRQPVIDLAREAGWDPLRIHPSLASQVVLSEPPRSGRSRRKHQRLRSLLLQNNVAATTYPQGLVRLSLPREGLSIADQARLQWALESVGESLEGRRKPALLPLAETWHSAAIHAM